MIGIAKLTSAAQAATYYEKDDYYVRGEQLAPSQWSGRGAQRLGLSGEVNREVFSQALQGHLPRGVDLPRNDDGNRDVGLDLSFNAPKSVSLLALVARDEGLMTAHRESVAAALQYIEDNAAIARVTVQGVTDHERTGNLLVAQFHHDTSREMDPHLHTHAVVLNATERQDGQWRALTNSAFYDLRHTADTLYRTELAARVQSLGYDVERTRADGQFEIAGLSREDLMRFSKRREAIEAALAERGEMGAEAAQRAALMTRAAKREVNRDELLKVWRTEVAAYQVELPTPDRARREAKTRQAERSSGAEASKPDPAEDRASRQAAKAALTHALDHLTERSAVVAERDILKHALQASVGKVERAEHVFEALHEMKSAKQVLTVEPDIKKGHDLDRYWTTPDALSAEQHILGMMQRGQGRVAPVLSAERLQAELSSRRLLETTDAQHGLTQGQADALTVALTTPDRVVGVQGYAGTGKTTALKHLREFAEGEGYEVRGFAPSAAAAQQLQSEAGIQSQTLARHLLQVHKEEASGSQELWVVDEASMMGNRVARQLLQAAEKRGARVVLVGDKEQLPSIEAGRVFRLLSERGMAVATMGEVLRQRDVDLKAAVLKTIGHEHDDALGHLDGRVQTISNRVERLQKVADTYLNSGPHRAETLVLTPSNEDRVELNARIRQGLRKEGALVGAEHRAEVLVGRGLTQAATTEASSYAEGEVVRFSRGYRSLGVQLGQTATVVAVDTDQNTVTLRSGVQLIQWQPHRHTNVEAYRVEERHLAAGDHIRWTRNEQAQGRRNGEYAQVLEVAADGATAKVRVGEGALQQEQVLDLKADRHWDHGYAVTVHAAQGQTRSRVLMHVDTSQRQLTGHEQWYVSISRAKDELTIFTDNEDRLPGRISRSQQKESALDARQKGHRGWQRQRERSDELS